MMNSLKDITERCHQRHKKSLQQRKTVATHWMYNKGYPHQYTVYCAHRYPVVLADLERANISFMPIGRAPQHDHGPRNFNSETRLLKRQGMKDWEIGRWRASWGIQAYTGAPSERNGAKWHDLHFKYEAICAVPDIVLACIDALVNAVVNPLLTLSNSGGLRFSCRIPNYLHPNTEEARLYIYKATPTDENPLQREGYLEILGEGGYSCWDARHEILLGNLLNPPTIDKEVLLAHIDTLRAVLHKPAPPRKQHPRPVPQTRTTLPSSLGSQNLDLAKASFVKRGFSYVREDDGFHHWTQPSGSIGSEDVLLWEQDDIVWIRALTPDIGLSMEATPITDVWDDTGILQLTTDSVLPISDRVLAVREGTLSPLGIKRPSVVLRKQEDTNKVYKTLEENAIQIQHAFDPIARIAGLLTKIGAGKTYELESYVLNGGRICLNVPTRRSAETAEQRFERRKLPSFAFWKSRMYLWEQVKEIPVDVRMASPFQHGNVCEDPERCDALEKKGGDPRESICPQCPVYTTCQQHGYLSQPTSFQHTQAQILAMPQLFFNPRYAALLEEILGEDNTDRLCIMDESQAHNLFLNCNISINVLETWSRNWQGEVLGNLAKALLNALETGWQKDNGVIKGIRSTVQLFQQQEKEIIRQMCQVNVKGRVVANRITDPETEKKLARFAIHFEGGTSAYIPLDNDAADRLRAMELPFFRLDFFVLNKDMKIPMQMEQAIELGILDIRTVENIQACPTVYPDPNWTFWHQLKHFFAHYKRDADAPMGWDNEVLQFWVPPVLHPRVERLLIMSSKLSERHFRRAFPDEETEVIQIEPAAWLSRNRIFQIRSDIYSLQTLLNYDNDWNGIRLSKMGWRFVVGIREEIERDPNVKHAIITYKPFTKWLEDIAKMDNVCCVTNFKEMDGFENSFQEAEVVWILGTPRWAAGIFWLRSQILFGNDEDPLHYDGEPESYRYEGERVQSVCDLHAVGLLTEAVERAGLNRYNDKTIVLVSSMVLPDITDRPETLLFDWEDFEVAGGLDRLAETIAIRQHFEAERDKLTAESSRETVEQILGCSPRQANRVLQRLRGGTPLRVPLREQILSALADGEKKTAELVEIVEGYPTAIKNELRRLVNAGEIERVKRGVYTIKAE